VSPRNSQHAAEVEQEMGESIHSSRDSMVVYMWYILHTISRLLSNLCLWTGANGQHPIGFRHGSHEYSSAQ